MLAQALHQFQVFHQGDGCHTPGDGQQAAGQQQPLVAIGKLAPAAAQRHPQLHQPQGGAGGVDRQVEIPGRRRAPQGGGQGRLPAGPQAGIGVEQQQPGPTAAGYP